MLIFAPHLCDGYSLVSVSFQSGAPALKHSLFASISSKDTGSKPLISTPAFFQYTHSAFYVFFYSCIAALINVTDIPEVFSDIFKIDKF